MNAATAVASRGSSQIQSSRAVAETPTQQNSMAENGRRGRRERRIHRNPICDLLAVGGFVLVCLFCVCFCRDPGDCPSFVHVLSLRHWVSKLWSGMGSDGFQTQRRGSWIPGEECAEKVLADAITIDGRREWICKFRSESTVWTRWRCRRCYYHIPAGLRGKYRQATAARTGFFVVKWRR